MTNRTLTAHAAAILLLFIATPSSAAVCGDALLSIFEQCDDGNREDGDGCSRSCLWEVPAEWTCDAAWYGSLDGCDCGCGSLDPDCISAAADVCRFNNCPPGESPGTVDNSRCFLPDGPPGAQCDITFALASSIANQGALQFRVDYTAAVGEFRGTGTGVVCEALVLADLSMRNDDDAQRGLTLGLVDFSGFAGPTNLWRCEFFRSAAEDPGPTAASFQIIIEDSTDADGTPIDADVVVSGIDCSGLMCGDGVRTGLEQCDDGNLTDDDGCSDCIVDPVCGDGIVSGDEGCDDGNLFDGDGCSSGCTTVCGDGMVAGDEHCDDGNASDGDGCSSTCTTLCGDGFVVGHEQCDDGNLDDGDGCSDCIITPVCGDGVVAGYEQCDDGNLTDGDGCSDCSTDPGCGDGFLDELEQCDDGNLDDGDGCSSTCTTLCGDGIVAGDEECDDGNLVDSDGCDIFCVRALPGNWHCPASYYGSFDGCDCGCGALDPDCVSPLATACDYNNCDIGPVTEHDNSQCGIVCGNGIVAESEQCDDGNLDDGDGCSSTCTTTCGDGVAAGYEECDDGNLTDGDGCSDCSTDPGCGDGILDELEQCDDGNLDDGDGCSSTCATLCGDGIVAGYEECDDGNTTEDDGCDGFCLRRAPANWVCHPAYYGGQDGCDCGCGVVDPDCVSSSADVCDFDFCGGVPITQGDNGQCDDVCGDGLQSPFEQCDDGNFDDGDGCSSNCTTTCGDGVVAGDEECDDGNASDGDGCSSICTALCGDGFVVGHEQCDDGNLDDGDGCSDCIVTPVCGDGMVAGEEECDDGNASDGDGCTDCTITPVCGDAVVAGFEQCDDGNLVDGDGCSSTCTTLCGDEIVAGYEECDDGNAGDDDGCADCIVTPICGDGIATGFEQCDDGNLDDGDGCSSTCTTLCGDEIVAGFEQCDDGNTNSGDGCFLCSLEVSPEWSCAVRNFNAGDGCDCGCGTIDPDCASALRSDCEFDGCSPSFSPDPVNNAACVPDCGDGFVSGGEQCDDGNLAAGDGCSPACQREIPAEWTCPDSYYGSGDGCDCGCGAPDGDCPSPSSGDCVFVNCTGGQSPYPEENHLCASFCLATPREDCRTSTTSALLVADSDTDDDDFVTWKWLRGAATDLGEISDPTATGRYNICLYPNGLLGGEFLLPASTGWSSFGRHGFNYGDRAATLGGLTALNLRVTHIRGTRITMKARGANLPDELLPASWYVAQLVDTDNGICWSSTILDAKVKPGLFRRLAYR